jgi:hypothetical protein
MNTFREALRSSASFHESSNRSSSSSERSTETSNMTTDGTSRAPSAWNVRDHNVKLRHDTPGKSQSVAVRYIASAAACRVHAREEVDA